MRDPLLVDTSLHRAFTLTYAIYVLTAVIAAFSLPPSLEAVGGQDLTRLWFIGLGVTSTFSLIFSLHESRQRKEMICTTLLLAFLTAYPAALIWNSTSTGSIDLLMIGVFTMSFAVMPLWRVLFFYRKYRKPRG